MEKMCEYDEAYTRQEANEMGFCEDCKSRNCRYANKCSNKHKQKNNWTRETVTPWDQPKKKDKPKKKFVKKSDYDDDDY